MRAVAVMIRISILAALMCCTATLAAADELYRAQTAVTGQGEANRSIGFAACLQDVLIKVSGAMKVADDPRLAAYQSRAGEFVKAFSYHDQMSGTPIRDEQGTRDRPYDLIVDFDESKIDDVLKALGLRPWLTHRPVLAVLVGMHLGATHFVVTADAGLSAVAPRQSLLASSQRRGMMIVLPSDDALAKSGIYAAALAKLPVSAWADRATELGGEVALVGQLKWDESDLVWAAEWQMQWQGRPHRWQLRAVTFDEVFRRAIGGAAQIISDNGDPA